MLPIWETSSIEDSGALTPTDGWLLRVATLIYVFFCAGSILTGLRARNPGTWKFFIGEMMTTYRSFSFLVTASSLVVSIYMIRPLFTTEYMSIVNPKEVWYMAVGISHVCYGLSEGRITLQRIPRALLSKRQNMLVSAMPYIFVVSLLSRVIVNLVVIGMRVGSSTSLNLQIVALVLGVISNLIFSGCEASMWMLTREMMTNGLQMSNPKLYQVTRVLSRANLLAMCASLIDVANNFLLSEVMEALVIINGAHVAGLYSKLMRPESQMSTHDDQSSMGVKGVKSALPPTVAVHSSALVEPVVEPF